TDTLVLDAAAQGIVRICNPVVDGHAERAEAVLRADTVLVGTVRVAESVVEFERLVVARDRQRTAGPDCGQAVHVAGVRRRNDVVGFTRRIHRTQGQATPVRAGVVQAVA